MSSAARQSTQRTGASISAAAAGATTSFRTTPTDPENARIANGMLVIEARRENFGGNAFTSARLKTQGKQSFGINTWVEARINAPEGQGSGRLSGCSATASVRLAGLRAERSTSWRSRARTHSETSARFTGPIQNGQHVSFGGIFNSSSSLTAGFHTFAISRTGTSIKWYVDRVQYAEANISGGINSTSEFQGTILHHPQRRGWRKLCRQSRRQHCISAADAG